MRPSTQHDPPKPPVTIGQGNGPYAETSRPKSSWKGKVAASANAPWETTEGST